MTAYHVSKLKKDLRVTKLRHVRGFAEIVTLATASAGRRTAIAETGRSTQADDPGAQAIDADVIDQWRTSNPFGKLCLVRRGTSLDKIRLDLCESNGIRVVNGLVADNDRRWTQQCDLYEQGLLG